MQGHRRRGANVKQSMVGSAFGGLLAVALLSLLLAICNDDGGDEDNDA